MKKIPIASQLIILFFTVLLASALAFTATTINRIRYIAEEETYSRLITYFTLLNSHNPENEIVDFRDMEVAFIKNEGNKTIASPDIEEYISSDDFTAICQIVSNDSKPVCNKMKNYKGQTIYFVIAAKDNLNNFSILITNSTYLNNLVKNVSVQLIVIFLVIICLSILGIAAWGNQFARRIHRIQDHILDLPKKEYSSSYTDNGQDEIGDLSRAVEAMRNEIQQSENTKKEMLQNISHDFKTPIAVIKSYAEAQQDGMADEQSSQIIISQAEILKHKVNRLLQYNSLEYLQKDKEFEEVNMKEVIEEVIRGYKFQTDLKIDLELDETVFFKGYRENYSTVVDNIVDNGKRYAKTIIKIVLKKDRLRIYNDGEPIDENFIKSAFKPYEKGSKGEFGLGMSIVKKTVEFFDMKLSVVNEENGGVSFIISK